MRCGVSRCTEPPVHPNINGQSGGFCVQHEPTWLNLVCHYPTQQPNKPYQYHCFYCGKQLSRRIRTKDHVVPVFRGGSNEPFNKVWACQSCNQLKGPLTGVEFQTIGNDRKAIDAMIREIMANRETELAFDRILTEAKLKTLLFPHVPDEFVRFRLTQEILALTLDKPEKRC